MVESILNELLIKPPAPQQHPATPPWHCSLRVFLKRKHSPLPRDGNTRPRAFSFGSQWTSNLRCRDSLFPYLFVLQNTGVTEGWGHFLRLAPLQAWLERRISDGLVEMTFGREKERKNIFKMTGSWEEGETEKMVDSLADIKQQGRLIKSKRKSCWKDCFQGVCQPLPRAGSNFIQMLQALVCLSQTERNQCYVLRTGELKQPTHRPVLLRCLGPSHSALRPKHVEIDE
ncbi:hypothetical protein C0Q70_01630 [Pomacea canaliculata]|uniref:Uncharacterized protein n=1 Tax=Pomacea canaliculata TaxID=400727 RepID=A0A2T7Q001_POMCA|nr:hypothetical protein C0Q70_01630 [Pomacea canaliculata]